MSLCYDIRGLSFSYPGQEAPALRGIHLEVEQGEFLVLCGPSGCGKSTLLRQLKPTLAPHGERQGAVLFQGRAVETLELREQAEAIGFVLQSPEDQVVTDKVWHELAFGLESLGYDTPTIRRRVAEMASFFGIQGWFYQDVAQLSGGQKQLLNLAAVMAMQPRVLILDEPTSQLDPIAAADFLATVAKINRELGTTVILTEHRLEEVFPLCSRVVVMEEGRVLLAGTPKEAGLALRCRDHAMFLAMPTPMRVWAGVAGAGEECPITVREGRDFLAAFARQNVVGQVPEEEVRRYPGPPAVTAQELWFRYEKHGPDVVKGLSLLVQRGEFMALLGGNGTGKTTALKLLAGLLKPIRGQVEVAGRVGMLPQSPQTLFVKKTVAEDLEDILAQDDPAGEKRLEEIVRLCRLEPLLARHPFDLSGGEQQRAALAKVLLLELEVLLLDEPTKGLDAGFKEELADILQELTSRGVSVVMVSHDVEFCARHAHHCALFFDGGIVNAATPRAFFSGNSFYTTAANRMAREVLPQAVTAEDVIAACGGEVPARPEAPAGEAGTVCPAPAPPAAPGGPGKSSFWRRAAAFVAGGVALIVLAHFLGLTDLRGVLALAGVTNGARRQVLLYGLFAGALAALGLAVKGPAAPAPEGRRTQPSRRSVLAAGLILLLVPLTLFWGVRYLGERKYYVTSLLILLECMAPFFLVFEGRRPKARELVVIAVLCAIGVAGRVVFFMLPEFKPVAALVVLAGAALGPETGFLVGSLTMLASNILFSQGPWTPWQMFAMGMVGFLAGAVFHSGLLRPRRWTLCLFGSVSALLIYGGIMNLQSALTWSYQLSWGVLAGYWAAGFPMDCIHAAATWVFLWFGGEGVLERLERVKRKYGI